LAIQLIPISLLRHILAQRGIHLVTGRTKRLFPRSEPGALIHDLAAAEAQVMQMLRMGTVTAVTGEQVPVRAETVCLHGDGPEALALARRLSDRLQAEDLL
jgi:UPF0271 protein